MSDFESLKADQGFAGSLLRSAAGDAPSAQARRLAASSLGLGLGTVATTSVVPSALAAGHALGTTTAQVVVPMGAKAISAVVVSKWLASSFLVGVVASTGAITVHEVTSREAPVTLHAQPTQAPERAPSDPQPAPVLEARAPEAEVTPPTRSHSLERSGAAAARFTEAGPSGAKTSARPLAQQPRAASLDEEIAWLEPVRRSLQAKDGSQALTALELATPHVRLLTSEASLLRVEALLLVGRRAEAERVAEPFLSRHPSSPHAQRLRHLLNLP